MRFPGMPSLGGLLCSQPFKYPSNLHSACQVIRGHLPHCIATCALADQQPLLFKRSERNTNRRARYTQELGSGDFGDALSCREFAIDNHFAQQI